MLPESVAALLAGRRCESVTTGRSGARVDRCGDRYLKVAPSLAGEAAVLQWMAAQGLPVPQVLGFATDADVDYLVMSALPGESAATPGRAGPAAVVRALADGLRRLHTVPIDGCPFDRRLAVTLAEARQRTRRGQVDEDDFDAARRGRTAYQLLAELEATRPAVEGAVFTHGDYCLPNVILHDGVVSGFVDCGRAGVADPYQDLALAARSVAHNLGPEWVAPLYDAYGPAAPDARRLAFYTLLDEFF